jgi:hypothetical protein
MGLPKDWKRVEGWLYFSGPMAYTSIDDHKSKLSEWPHLKILDDYSKPPPEDFWQSFPSRPLPLIAETDIDICELENQIREKKHRMTSHQLERCQRTVDYLKNGAPSFQCSDLPGCFVKNSSSTIVHGREVTENVATWVREGYAAGPFNSPPCPNFRVNPLIAVVQPGKVRPVLDVSSPQGNSYNSNVDKFSTETVKMASAKKFSQVLLDCGKNAKMSKHDLVAAYKQMPCKVEDLRMQGFQWLGKYFVETRQVFGAKTSVCNYDNLGETLKLLAILECNIPPNLVLRQVDDVPSVAPADTFICENFSAVYRMICKKLNVKLAENCPLNDKAFEVQVRGKVLGVMFDSTDLSWRLSDKKIAKARNSIVSVLSANSTTLKDCQRLLGRLNDISQLCPFLKCFKLPVTETLAGIPADSPKDLPLEFSAQAKRDLMVWAGFLWSEFKWLPIPREIHAPPLFCKEFVSDAAGLAVEADPTTGPGCGNVGFAEDGQIIFAHSMRWPKSFIRDKTDSNGIRFGDKTTTLETLGLLLPMLVSPELFRNSHVVVKVDCFGTIYGMINGAAKGDTNASILIRAAHIIAAYLECTLHVQHLPRMSDWGAEVADRLSRNSTMTRQDRKLANAFKCRPLPPCLVEWLDNPVADWSLATALLQHVSKLV